MKRVAYAQDVLTVDNSGLQLMRVLAVVGSSVGYRCCDSVPQRQRHHQMMRPRNSRRLLNRLQCLDLSDKIETEKQSVRVAPAAQIAVHAYTLRRQNDDITRITAETSLRHRLLLSCASLGISVSKPHAVPGTSADVLLMRSVCNR